MEFPHLTTHERELGINRQSWLRTRSVDLTPREREVARLLECNLSNAEIARQLGIKCGTVEIHLHKILIKHARSRQSSKGGKTAQVDRLTARQYQVAMLVARGLTNREVASQLGLTEGTVKLQMYNILLKLGLRRRYAIISLRSLLERKNALRPLAQAKTSK